MAYFKALTPDRKSFYDGSTQWTLGKPMPVINGHKNGLCGPGYHLGKSVTEAARYAKFPLRLFRAEPCGELLGEDGGKARFSSAKITKQLKTPLWVRRTEKFIESIKFVSWFKPSDKPLRKWQMFNTRTAAWDAVRAAGGRMAWGSARTAAKTAAWGAVGSAAGYAAGYAAWDAIGAAAGGAAGDAAREAGGDARLMAWMELAADLKVLKKHRDHARERWRVWQAGYGLLCDVDGKLYCYKRVR